MKPLSALFESLAAETAAKEVIGELFAKVNSGIEDKIIMEMIPQYSINRTNDLSSDVIRTLEARYQCTKRDFNWTIEQPKPSHFDKLMQRSGKFSGGAQSNNYLGLYESMKQQPSNIRLKQQLEENPKPSPRRFIEGLKQEYAKSSFQLSLVSPNNPSESQSMLRKRKQEEERRKQKDESNSIETSNLNTQKTEKQIGTLLHLRKDYTYDYNGSIIPVNKIEKTTHPRLQIHYEVPDKAKEKAQYNPAPHNRMKSRLKKTELKLEQTQSCFYDVQSPFYRNFESQKRNFETKLREAPDKVQNEQLPNYMRILTQEGGIKKRYARYNIQNNEPLNLSFVKEKFKESPLKSQNGSRMITKRLESTTNPSLLHLPSRNRIRIIDEALRQKVIESSSDSQLEYDLSNSAVLSKSQLVNLRGKACRQLSISRQVR